MSFGIKTSYTQTSYAIVEKHVIPLDPVNAMMRFLKTPKEVTSNGLKSLENIFEELLME